MNDLDIIKQLEQEIGKELGQISLDEVTSYPRQNGYAVDENNNVIGLNLDESKLSTIPNALINLKNLQILSLNSNKIAQLPDSFGQLQNLSFLSLSNNQLKELPASFGQLKNLSKLWLQENQLKELPASFGQLQNLSELSLWNNPLETPPREIAKKGIKAIRNYFEQLEQGQDTIYEAKILIIGEGAAGKTSLANKLIDSNYQLKQREPSTEGIDILQWQFNFEPDKTFRVNLWDFGGQEIYHATHQFFLTNRSLYVLVADTRKENTDFFYWLQIVELLADQSPVIIIKNEKDDRQCEIKEEDELRGLFKNFKCTLATNLADNRGLETIQKALQYQLQTLPHVGTKLPKTWADVRKTLENDKRHYIDHKQFLTICEQNGFKKRADKDQLLLFLHDLGVCLHFKDDPLLRRTVILKPEWGTDAVYKVLDNQAVKDNQGQFNKQDVAHIWQAEQYDDMHDELLQLMMNFKLCYKLTYCDIYIAPQLLSRKKPEYNLNTENNLLLRYNYKFMPKGMMTQFIVAIHKNIADEQRLVWRDGVILERDETRAEIIEFYDNREVKIRIKGKMPRELAYFITSEWDKIHDGYHNLKVQKLIPCNCPKCKNNQQPHFYEYSVLQQFISDGQAKIQCQKSYQMMDVRQLLGDTFVQEKYTDNRGKTPSVLIENRIFNNTGEMKESNANQGDNTQQQLTHRDLEQHK